MALFLLLAAAKLSSHHQNANLPQYFIAAICKPPTKEGRSICCSSFRALANSYNNFVFVCLAMIIHAESASSDVEATISTPNPTMLMPNPPILMPNSAVLMPAVRGRKARWRTDAAGGKEMLGKEPTIVKLHSHTHKRQEDQHGVDERARRAYDEYTRLRESQAVAGEGSSRGSADIFNYRTWL
ncbi:hypothetical protein IEQ34_014498 [Dendrobium chrysotoxum]|uniref:Uncharacterized protein n=1 Tax=Dendrobium chrysotoxum TaxID=161865 RepID=A0AAV7GKG5_DENCH|nr:hypothetical protein IEQ34_014498 [Dendrobium chrysotoxum]